MRSYWPQMLTSWVRLLDGQFRDPLVGRDMLVGVAAAVLTLRSRRSQRVAAGPLNRDDEQRLQDLLGKTEKDS